LEAIAVEAAQAARAVTHPACHQREHDSLTALLTVWSGRERRVVEAQERLGRVAHHIEGAELPGLAALRSAVGRERVVALVDDLVGGV